MKKVETFNVVADGKTDNTAAMQAAVNWATSNNSVIILPAGTIYLAGALNVNLGSAGFGIIGQGQDISNLEFASGFGLTINVNSPNQSFRISNMSILTQGVNTGTAINLNNTYTPGTYYTATNRIENITFQGSDGRGATNYWQYGIKNNYVPNIYFHGLNFNGTGAIGGTGVALLGSSQYASVVYNFHQCQFNALNIGLQIGNNVQGVTLVQVNMTAVNTGIDVPPEQVGNSQLSVSGGSQFAAYVCAISIKSPGFNGVSITNTVFIVLSTSAVAIAIIACSSVICSNTLISAVSGGSKGVEVLSGAGISIYSNTFLNFGVALTILNGVVGAVAKGNGYIGGSSKDIVSDSAVGNSIWPSVYSIALITAAMSNGINNGLTRLTVSSTSQLFSGQVVYIHFDGGKQSFSGLCIISVVSPTAVDLEGLSFVDGFAGTCKGWLTSAP